jgi:hypothetical protein
MTLWIKAHVISVDEEIVIQMTKILGGARIVESQVKFKNLFDGSNI